MNKIFYTKNKFLGYYGERQVMLKSYYFFDFKYYSYIYTI